MPWDPSEYLGQQGQDSLRAFQILASDSPFSTIHISYLTKGFASRPQVTPAFTLTGLLTTLGHLPMLGSQLDCLDIFISPPLSWFWLPNH